MPAVHLRRVRSFVRRPGRTTAGQTRALERLFPVWGIAFSRETLDLSAVFGRSAPCVLDIGFGNGEALLTMAANHSEVDFVGVEVHEPGVGHLLMLVERAGVTNIRVINRDVIDVIDAMIADESFDAVNIFFPDPWPKKRHHKRRLIQNGFVRKLARTMKRGALLHVATDWQDYAEQIQTVLHQAGSLVEATKDQLRECPLAARPPTKFERRGIRLGHSVWDLYYRTRARDRNR
jgi:tRNA (guanine-N7-)-methyltransferase